MISEGKIGPAEAASIPLLLLSVNTLYASVPATDYGLSANWLVILLAGLLSCIGVFFSAQLMQNYPEQSIIEVSRTVLGPVIGSVIGLVFLSQFLFGCALFLRLETDRILTVYLPNTPFYAMMGLFVLVGIGGAYIGLEALARTTKILIVFIIGSILLPLFLTYNYWDWNNLFPLGGSGLHGIAQGGLSMSGMFTEIIILAVIFPAIKISSPKRLWYQPLLIAICLHVLVALLVLLIFGTPSLNETLFPVVQSARLIYLGRFVQRIDIFFAFFWMIGICLKYIILFFAADEILTRLLKLPYRVPFLVPLGIIVTSLAFLPNDMIQTGQIITDLVWRWNGLATFGLMLLILLVHYLKPPGKSGHSWGKEGANAATEN